MTVPANRHAVFDCPTGIAGDMAVGALLDLGFPIEEIRARVSALGVKGLEVSAEKVQRGGVAGTKYVVTAPHEHAHRGLREITPMIDRAGLSPAAAAIAHDVFRRLAVAEASIHATTPEEVHFHEVGAADALADVVGFATAYAGLGLVSGEARAFPLPWSRGAVEAAHGMLPVPAPATRALLAGFAWRNTEIEGELVTPTGAAILAAVAKPVERGYTFTALKNGYGAGTRDVPGMPNHTWVMLAAATGASANTGREETAVIVEANLDDLSPQLSAVLADRLREGGALDVWTTPVQMKKGRPGIVVSALVPADGIEALSAIFFRESTTLGVRITRVERRVLDRELVSVETAFGPIRVKVGRQAGLVVNLAPEFEDVRAAAERAGAPVKVVHAEASRAAEAQLGRTPAR